MDWARFVCSNTNPNMPLQTRLLTLCLTPLQTGVPVLPWGCRCQSNMRFLGRFASLKQSIFGPNWRTVQKKTNMRFDL